MQEKLKKSGEILKTHQIYKFLIHVNRVTCILVRVTVISFINRYNTTKPAGIYMLENKVSNRTLEFKDNIWINSSNRDGKFLTALRQTVGFIVRSQYSYLEYA